MKDDRNDPRDPRRETALFRYRLIADLLHPPPGAPPLAEALRARAAEERPVPGSRRRKVSVETLRHWMRLHRKGGFDALYPKPRADRGLARGIPPALAEKLVGIKTDEPLLSVRLVIKRALDLGLVPDGARLAGSTVYRLLQRRGLTTRRRSDGPPEDLRRFAYENAGELWMADAMHGPKAGCDPRDARRRRKTYLLAAIDDATRVIPYAAFAFSESSDSFLTVLRQALERRGVPRRLYTDNGSTFRSKHLEAVCAALDIALIHSRPYRPQGRGKVERFFGTVRAQFLPALREEDTRGLEALNARLRTWVEEEYHRTPHRGLGAGETPLDRWARTGAGVRYPAPDLDLGAVFRHRLQRRVSKARTVSVRGMLYEVGPDLSGCNVVLTPDPEAPPERPIPVLLDGRPAGEAVPLDLHANARSGRSGRQGPGGTEGGAAPPPLALRDLERGQGGA